MKTCFIELKTVAIQVFIIRLLTPSLHLLKTNRFQSRLLADKSLTSVKSFQWFLGEGILILRYVYTIFFIVWEIKSFLKKKKFLYVYSGSWRFLLPWILSTVSQAFTKFFKAFKKWSVVFFVFFFIKPSLNLMSLTLLLTELNVKP